MKLKTIVGGIKSFLPLSSDYKGTGGTVRGSYCYAVWLRHLALLRHAFPGFEVETLVEFGPGDTIGTGLAALLSGTKRYFALDVLQHANASSNLVALDQLIDLLRVRASIPGDDIFPGVYPRLKSYEFSQSGVTDAVLEAALRPSHVASLKRDLAGGSNNLITSSLRYVCPWAKTLEIPPGSVDLVMGQVVLQDMDDRDDEDVLSTAFKASARWLRHGGLFSQQIDFSTPGSNFWNDHWTYPDSVWRLVRGRRPYYPNRAPLSRYIELCRQNGFEIVHSIVTRDTSGHSREALVARFRTLPDLDLTARNAYLLAVKK